MDTSSAAPAVLGHLGPAGDHNPNPLDAVPMLLAAAAAATHRPVRLLGEPFEVAERSSAGHLEAARPSLLEYADAVSAQLSAGHHLVSVTGRCAASLASLPRVVRAHPDAVVVWLDAHADLNVPGGSRTDYLGGMAVSGPLGWWGSGLGSGLVPERLVLVGTRSVDAAEAELIARHRIAVLPRELATGAALAEVVGGRPVHVHLDCDALEPGLFVTDYREPGGLSLGQLAELATGLAAASAVVGLEIAEWEGPAAGTAEDLLAALAPLLPPARGKGATDGSGPL